MAKRKVTPAREIAELYVWNRPQSEIAARQLELGVSDEKVLDEMQEFLIEAQNEQARLNRLSAKLEKARDELVRDGLDKLASNILQVQG